MDRRLAPSAQGFHVPRTPSPLGERRSTKEPSKEPPPYSLQDELEIRYQTYARRLHWLRIIISTFILVVSAAVIGCTADSLKEYHHTSAPPSWYLPLWPTDIDIRPTQVLLGCGVFVLVLNAIYIAAAFVPRPTLPSKLRLLNITATLTSFIGLVCSLFAIVFTTSVNAYLSQDGSATGTIQSWTCKWQAMGDVVPADFPTMCKESWAAEGLIIILIVTKAFAVLATGVGWWLELKIGRGKGGQEKNSSKLESA